MNRAARHLFWHKIDIDIDIDIFQINDSVDYQAYLASSIHNFLTSKKKPNNWIN